MINPVHISIGLIRPSGKRKEAEEKVVALSTCCQGNKSSCERDGISSKLVYSESVPGGSSGFGATVTVLYMNCFVLLIHLLGAW